MGGLKCHDIQPVCLSPLGFFRHLKWELGLYFIVFMLQCVPIKSRISWLSLRIDEIDGFIQVICSILPAYYSDTSILYAAPLYEQKITAQYWFMT